jgi:hypothetical protein
MIVKTFQLFVNYDVVVGDHDDDAEEQDTYNDNNSNNNIHDKYCLITKK